MSFFEVETVIVKHQGSSIRRHGEALGPVAERAREAGAQASACGVPEAVAALDRFTTVLAARTELMHQALLGIGDALGTTAAAYDRVDGMLADQLQGLDTIGTRGVAH